MDFVSLSYGLFLIIGVTIYYIIPKKKQWIWLLLLSIFFYASFSVKSTVFIGFSAVTSYLYGRYVDYTCQKYKNKKNKTGNLTRKDVKSQQGQVLFLTIFVNIAVLFFIRFGIVGGLLNPYMDTDFFRVIVPVGISFYTLQVCAYMVDVYKGKIESEKNFFHYLLFVTYFPQILQGPIPRFEQLSKQFFKEHSISFQKICDKLCIIGVGLFLKLVIADNAAIVVNRIFGEYKSYEGFTILLGGFLYSIQLYADFLGCVTIARGSSGLFQIELISNFNHPYFSMSIKEFWGRWHISLSSFLRDYIYIPLGGNRKGTFRKYVNILVTFLVSGIWHGVGLQFVVWGVLHGLYQIIGEILMPVRDFANRKLQINRTNFFHRLVKTGVTFFLVMIAWIMFRADSAQMGFEMIVSMFSSFNPYVLWDETFYNLGLNGKEFRLLIFHIFLLFGVEILQTKMDLFAWFKRQHLLLRWVIIYAVIFGIIIFGAYGPGYDSSQFIYGNF